MAGHGAAAAVRVESGDAELLRQLGAGSGTGRVHSVFARVVNVLTPEDALIALAARGSGDAPRTLTADVGGWAGRGLAAGQPVAFAPGCLTLAVPGRPLCLTVAGARHWYTIRPTLAGLPAGACAAAAARIDRLNHTYGPRGGMLGAAPGAGPMDDAVVRALHTGRAELTAGIRARDTAATRRGVLALLGLGPGLTPAGDDFLTGLVFVAALPGSALAGFVPVLREVLDAHPGRTTDVALATLREAARGRARAELLDLLRLLEGAAGPLDLHAPVRAVLAVGHTSGSDTLSGLAAGLHLEEELRGPL
ncbi:oxamate carbamoyltransferase subunit AllH family protein [Streptomyces sp. NPDC004031]